MLPVNTGVVTVAVVPMFGFHVYVVAPVAVKLAVEPEQMVGEFTATVGFDFTRIDLVAAALGVAPL